VRRRIARGLLLLVAAAPACALLGPARPGVEGVVRGPAAVALPPGAVVRIELVDLWQQDERDAVVAQQVIRDAAALPLRFDIPLAAPVNPSHPYDVRAAITVGGRLAYISRSAVPVLHPGPRIRVEVRVDPVD
jgi:putative lipoprotein